MGKERYSLTLDVGGTSLKSAIISSKAQLLNGCFRKTPVDSQGTAGAIFGTFSKTLELHLQEAKELDLGVAGLGVAMPGPFDYGKGISLMKRKFGGIYGLNLKRELIKRLGLPEDFLIRFEVDAWLFLRGEAWLGAAQGYNRVSGITLGTGLGSGFMINNDIVAEGSGVPSNAWIGGMPYGDGIVEDKISRRGIIARHKELGRRSSQENLDVKEIALRGLEQGDETSLQVFRELGSTLGQILKPILSVFKAECLVLGGQISKSFSLFEEPLKRELEDISSLRKITRARLGDQSALYGAAKLVFQKKAKDWGVVGL